MPKCQMILQDSGGLRQGLAYGNREVWHTQLIPVGSSIILLLHLLACCCCICYMACPDGQTTCFSTFHIQNGHIFWCRTPVSPPSGISRWENRPVVQCLVAHINCLIFLWWNPRGVSQFLFVAHLIIAGKVKTARSRNHSIPEATLVRCDKRFLPLVLPVQESHFCSLNVACFRHPRKKVKMMPWEPLGCSSSISVACF